MNQEINYEKDVFIDENSLDVMWLEAADLMMRYTKNLAKAERDVDLIKEKLSLLRAELDKDIRSSPEAYDLEKITESVVTNTIIVQEEYKELQQELIVAQFEAKVAKGAVDAMHHRKAALQDLVQLYISGYFAGPTMPRNLADERAMVQKKRQEESNKAIRIGKRSRRK